MEIVYRAPTAITSGHPAKARMVGSYCLIETHHSADLRLPWHDHEDASINIVLSGGFDERIGGRGVVNQPGTVVVKPAGAHHSNRYGHSPTVSLLIHPAPDALLQLGMAARAFGRVRVREGPRILTLGKRVAAALHRNSDAPGVELALDDMILSLAGISAPSARTTGIPSWLPRIRDELMSRTSVGPSLGTMARREGVSLSTVTKAFRRAYGCSPTAFMREARIATVKRMLADDAMPLTDVAFSAGFADQAHLTRVFKQETALTPGQYRRGLVAPRHYCTRKTG